MSRSDSRIAVRSIVRIKKGVFGSRDSARMLWRNMCSPDMRDRTLLPVRKRRIVEGERIFFRDAGRQFAKYLVSLRINRTAHRAIPLSGFWLLFHRWIGHLNGRIGSLRDDGRW